MSVRDCPCLPDPPAGPEFHPPPAPPEPDYVFLGAATVRLFEDGSGWLRMTVAEDRSYLGVKIVRGFPHTDPEHWWAVLSARGGDRVIGLLRDPERLDAESLRLARAALERYYFIPTITRVISLREEFGAVYFDVETDRGLCRFVTRGLRDAMEELPDGQMLLPDSQGNRYRIRGWGYLDARSRGLMERIM